MHFVLIGQIPSGKNAVMTTRTGKHYPNARFKAWRDDALLQLRAIKAIPHSAHTLPVILRCRYTPGDQRTRDVSGMCDAIFHLLTYARILEDDGLIYDVHWYRQPMNRLSPRVEIQIATWTGE